MRVISLSIAACIGVKLWHALAHNLKRMMALNFAFTA